MRVRFVNEDLRSPADHHVDMVYSDNGIDALAEFVHPDAAVAWDRDCADVVLVQSDYIPHGDTLPVPAIRVSLCDGIFDIFTGDPGTLAVRWDPKDLRWVRP